MDLLKIGLRQQNDDIATLFTVEDPTSDVIDRLVDARMSWIGQVLEANNTVRETLAEIKQTCIQGKLYGTTFDQPTYSFELDKAVRQISTVEEERANILLYRNKMDRLKAEYSNNCRDTEGSKPDEAGGETRNLTDSDEASTSEDEDCEVTLNAHQVTTSAAYYKGSPGYGRKLKRNTQCFYCGEFGHIQRFCSSKNTAISNVVSIQYRGSTSRRKKKQGDTNLGEGSATKNNVVFCRMLTTSRPRKQIRTKTQDMALYNPSNPISSPGIFLTGDRKALTTLQVLCDGKAELDRWRASRRCREAQSELQEWTRSKTGEGGQKEKIGESEFDGVINCCSYNKNMTMAAKLVALETFWDKSNPLLHKNDENVGNKMLEHHGINFGNALCENSVSPRESRSDSSEGEDSITNQDQNKNLSPLLESYDDSSKGEVSVEEQKLFEDQYSRNLAEAKELEGVVNECIQIATQYKKEVKTTDWRDPSPILKLVEEARRVLERWEMLISPWAGTERDE